jgi:hypothetical protein
MLAIEKKEINDSNLITIIDTLINDYKNSINNCRSKFIASQDIYDSLLSNTITMIESFKDTLNRNLSTIICANDNFDKLPYGTVITCARDSVSPSPDNIKKYKATLDKIYDIHDKILKIQLIFILIIYNLKKDTLAKLYREEVYIYSAILYKILDNLLIVILKILKNITIYKTDISKYRYTISVRRFYRNMLESDNSINSYIITNNDSVSYSIDSYPELKDLNMYSKKLPLSFNEKAVQNITEFDIINKISEIKILVSTFATINKIEDYSILIKKEKQPDNIIDYNREYESILSNSIDDVYINDEELLAEEYEAMLKIN